MIKIKNSVEGAEIHINGDIIDDQDGRLLSAFGLDEGFQWPADIRKQLDEIDGAKPLTVYINSDGGSVNAGVAIANMIARHKGPTTAIVEGWACSVATEIFFAAQKRQIPANAYLMIHKPSCIAQGNADDLLQAAATLDTIQEGLEATYRNAKRQNVTDEEIHQMVDETTWLTGEEAARYFKVEVLRPSQTAAKFGEARALLDKIPASLALVNAKAEELAKEKRKAQSESIKAALMAAEGIETNEKI